MFWERPPSENRDTALIFGVQRSEMLCLRREGQHTVVEPVKTKSHSEGQRFLAPQIGGGFGIRSFYCGFAAVMCATVRKLG